MEIGSINQNKSLDTDKSYKILEPAKVSESVESNDLQSENGNEEKKVKDAVKKINKLLQGESTHLQYEKHDVLNQMIIRVINNNTNEVIKEIPSRKVLDLVAKLCEMAGVLVDKKA